MMERLETAHRVLVVDDEPDLVDMVLRMLRGHYQAVGSTSAAEALEWLEERRFDAVLVDQRLRDGTGTSVLARCAAIAPLCRRVAMSGQAELGDLLAAINVAKVSRFLLKPLSRETLLATLADALGEYEAERAALERWLIENAAAAGERHQVAVKRSGGRRGRGRGRPAHWPTGPGVRRLLPEEPRPLVELFDPDLDVVLASLRCDRVMDLASAREWAAELELRLVTRLRDTDQAFRMPGDRFVVVFARTSKVGARRACHRLAEGMPAGVLIDLVHWPEDTGAPPAEVVGRFLAR
ncbi:MAG TPA: response regulator [Kofleriaceae bacterium]|nr:response regulator [Kofleriaceae bacterium]